MLVPHLCVLKHAKHTMKNSSKSENVCRLQRSNEWCTEALPEVQGSLLLATQGAISRLSVTRYTLVPVQTCAKPTFPMNLWRSTTISHIPWCCTTTNNLQLTSTKMGTLLPRAMSKHQSSNPLPEPNIDLPSFLLRNFLLWKDLSSCSSLVGGDRNTLRSISITYHLQHAVKTRCQLISPLTSKPAFLRQAKKKYMREFEKEYQDVVPPSERILENGLGTAHRKSKMHLPSEANSTAAISHHPPQIMTSSKQTNKQTGEGSKATY